MKFTRLHLMLTREILPLFIGMLFLFIVIFELIYFFGELTRYLSNPEIQFIKFFKAMFYYIPISVSYSLALAFLFSLVFTLSGFYERNEIIVIITSGVKIFQFNLPVLIIGFLISVGSFFFDNYIVVKSEHIRNQLSREYFQGNQIDPQTVNIAITKQGIYIASEIDPANSEMKKVSFVENGMRRRIDAQKAIWRAEENIWELRDVRVLRFDEDGTLQQEIKYILKDEKLNEPISTFTAPIIPIEEMNIRDAYNYLQSRKRRNLPYLKNAVDFHQRFANTFTPLIVSLIGLSMVSIVASLRQKTMLIGLLCSVALSVLFYIVRLLAGVAGTAGWVDPWLSGWLPIIIFLPLGILLFLYSPS